MLPKDVVNTDQEKWKNYVKERRCDAKGRGSIYSNKGKALSGLWIAAVQAWVLPALLHLPQSALMARLLGPIPCCATSANQAALFRNITVHLPGLLKICLQVYAAISAARRSCVPRRTASAAACWTTPGPAQVSLFVLHNLIGPSELVMQAFMAEYLQLWPTVHSVTMLTAVFHCLKPTAHSCQLVLS